MKNIRKFEMLTEKMEAIIEEYSVSYVNEENKVYTTPENGEQAVVDYSSQYLTFEAIEDSTFKLTKNYCSYSLDEGETWTSLPNGTDTPTVPAGNKIMFRGQAYLYTDYGNEGIGIFSSTGKFNVSGNIMSLLYGDDFIGKTDLTDKNYAFKNLFSYCTNVVEAHNLILPATTLANSCYREMFDGCTSLTTAPELPATTLANDCYRSMFYNCSNLTTVTSILPATTLDESCCWSMFAYCTSLTKAPELPSTTLAHSCYYNMFYGCTSLTTAPELPATTLAEYCYDNMFQHCTSLNHITMLATDISATKCLDSWVYNVSSTGTFIKNPDMDSLPDGEDGIPNGWTVVDYSSQSPA